MSVTGCHKNAVGADALRGLQLRPQLSNLARHFHRIAIMESLRGCHTGIHPQTRFIVKFAEQSIVLRTKLCLARVFSRQQIELPGLRRGRCIPGGNAGKARLVKRIGLQFYLPAGRIPLVEFGTVLRQICITTAANISQRDIQRGQLLGEVVFIIRILEEIADSQTLSQLLVYPQRRFAFALRFDDRLSNEGAVANHGKRVVALQVRSFRQNHI